MSKPYCEIFQERTKSGEKVGSRWVCTFGALIQADTAAFLTADVIE